MAHDSSINFIVPEQGTFAVFENMVIPAQSTHQEQVYSFINFLYQPQRMKQRVTSTYFFSPLNENAAENMPERIRSFFNFDKQSFLKMQFFKDVISRPSVTALWTQLKA
jgi:spermidine/putrescine-binding protein